jgi:hypothetical protein
VRGWGDGKFHAFLLDSLLAHFDKNEYQSIRYSICDTTLGITSKVTQTMLLLETATQATAAEACNTSTCVEHALAFEAGTSRLRG